MQNPSPKFPKEEKKQFKREHTLNNCLDIIIFPTDWTEKDIALAKEILTDEGILFSEKELAEQERIKALRKEAVQKDFDRKNYQYFRRLFSSGFWISCLIILTIVIFFFILKK